MLLKYFKFLESKKLVFTDYTSKVEMEDDDYSKLINSESMTLKEFKILQKKLESISKLIGFNFEFQSEQVNNIYKHKIDIDFDLQSVKSSFLYIINQLLINIKTTNIWFYIGDRYLIKRSITIGSKLLGLSSTPDAKVINTNSSNIAYQEIMEYIIQLMISCKDELHVSNKHFDVSELRIILLSLLGANKSLTKKPTLNKPAKDYLNDKLSHSTKAHDIINSMKINNPLLYKLYTSGDKPNYNTSNKLGDMGFSD